MKRFLSAFAALSLVCAAAQAAPLDLKDVAANAKWVVHIDVDAVRDSQVVQKAFETCPLLKDSGKHFDMIRDKIGVDLRKDLHGITLYGPDTDKAHGVAIVFSTVNQELLLEKAKKGAKATKHGSFDIYSWTQKHGTKSHPAAGAFFKPDVLVFAADAERVAAALDVLDGKSPGITDPKSPLGGRIAAGTSLLARSTVVPPKTRCPVLKEAESFRIALGEHDGKSFYRARLVMKSAEAAGQVQAINDGFKALASLKFSGDAEVMKLVDALKTTTKDNTVRVRWEASADDVWNVAQKLCKQAVEHMKKHGVGPWSKAGKGKAQAGKCPPGCQCPACKAKAEKAKADKAKESKAEK